MSIFNCPGMERMRVAFPDEIPCACGEKVEMWPDEAEASCPKCGKMVKRKTAPSCIEWCEAARECVGGELYDRYMRTTGKYRKDKSKNKKEEQE